MSREFLSAKNAYYLKIVFLRILSRGKGKPWVGAFKSIVGHPGDAGAGLCGRAAPGQHQGSTRAAPGQHQGSTRA